MRGRRAPVVGRLCMDQMLVDVTGIEEAGMGDAVTLIGRDGPQGDPGRGAGGAVRHHLATSCWPGFRPAGAGVRGG